MPYTLTMPKLSPTMEEGTIAKWHKREGDYVEAGDLLLEVATDKATVEHSALDSGYMKKILVNEGDEAVVNQAIAVMTEDEKESIDGYEPEGIQVEEESAAQQQEVEGEKSEEKPKSGKSKNRSFDQPEFVPEPPLENYRFEQVTELPERIKASPLAKKLAKEQGLDIKTVQGSGPGGRIMERDLVKAQPASEFSFAPPERPSEVPGSYDDEKLTPIRKTIAKRLQESKTFIPHFYVEQSVNVEALVSQRMQLRNLGVKVSLNDCVVKAVALALRKHPNVNSGFNSVNQSIIRFKTIDVSVAVSTEDGLITPIVRHADFKNLGEISAEIREMAGRAKLGKLEQHEYKGGSFTVSNLGMYGVSNFAAIINPPQAGILAISGVKTVPVVSKDGAIVVGKVMNITISADHRVIDGVAAARFINTVKEYLENPACLLL